MDLLGEKGCVLEATGETTDQNGSALTLMCPSFKQVRVCGWEMDPFVSKCKENGLEREDIKSTVFCDWL